MKKWIALFLLSFSLASAKLVEWVGYGSQRNLDVPLTEEDASGVFFRQVQYRLTKRGWGMIVPEGKVGTRGDAIVFINCPSWEYFQFHGLLRNPIKKVLVTWEPPTVVSENHDPKFHKLFDRIVTWNTKLIDGKRYLQYWYPVYSGMNKSVPSFHERSLVCILLADKSSTHPKELYTERRSIIHFYEMHPNLPFHLYGMGWEKNNFQSYVSAPPDKHEVMKNYRFTYAYENYRNEEGYITEKIFDAFYNGTVPIYLGASNINDFVPANCFIDPRNFPSYLALHQFLETMDETTWNWYQNNIRNFLNTPEAKRFNMTTLADAIERAILE